MIEAVVARSRQTDKIYIDIYIYIYIYLKKAGRRCGKRGFLCLQHPLYISLYSFPFFKYYLLFSLSFSLFIYISGRVIIQGGHPLLMRKHPKIKIETLHVNLFIFDAKFSRLREKADFYDNGNRIRFETTKKSGTHGWLSSVSAAPPLPPSSKELEVGGQVL